MGPRISTLSIEQFRALRKLRIEGLGRVNLITGRNNTGKSSVLEALSLFASNASPSVIARILRGREEYVEESGGPIGLTGGEDFWMTASLFTGFSPLEASRAPIVISADGHDQAWCLSLSMSRVIQEMLEDGIRHWTLEPEGSLPDPDSVPALIIETETGRRRILRLEILRAFLDRPKIDSWPEAPRFPSVYVSPYEAEHTSALGPLWDEIALTDVQKDVVDALRIVAADVDAVSMIGGQGSGRSRYAIVRSGRFPRPVPLRSYGDGLNRLFGIVLSLVTAKDGILLVDEIENGMHYSVQRDLWRVIFRLSSQLDVQVFATSHSWDSVASFQEAASETPEIGALVRLTRRGNDILPTVFHEDELAIATRDRIEVR